MASTLSPQIEQMKEISLVIIPASLSEDRLPELGGGLCARRENCTTGRLAKLFSCLNDLKHLEAPHFPLTVSSRTLFLGSVRGVKYFLMG